jgi:uncharacterized hydrophobic protein (TIGR00271 family)
LTIERRAEVQVLLRDACTPDFDFFLLVALSGVIAASGLITNSAAVIIGAMLVAPLMSPILGISLASITADTRMARDAITGLLRGMLLAVAVALVLTWLAQILPFNPITNPSELPDEILSRTHPSPFDLGIAVAGGMAAAFALAQPQLSAALPGVAIATALMPPLCTIGVGLALREPTIAGGAFLLYLTNLAAIGFAGVLTFYGLGFRPPGEMLDLRRLPRSLVFSAVLVALLVFPLAYVSASFFNQGREDLMIREVVTEALLSRNADLVNIEITSRSDPFRMEISARSPNFTHEESVDLRDELAQSLLSEGFEFSSFELILTIIPYSQLDPLIPPTATPTNTMGPSPTATFSPTPTNSPTPTPTATPTTTSTSTPSSTPTPSRLVIAHTDGLGLNLRADPFGAVIAKLAEGDQVTMLYGQVIQDGLVWVEVQDEDGRIGWILIFYSDVITLTPAPSPTPEQ